MARKTIIFLCLFAVHCAGKSVSKDDHCNGLECPKFKVLETTDDYEVRQYPSYKWAAAREVGLDYRDASGKNFMKLFRYIQGNNADKKKIEMTDPVVTHLTVSQGPFCEADYTMHFFVPFELQSNVPKPLNDTDQVKIVDIKEMIVFVRSYPGFPTVSAIQENAAKLTKALGDEGLKFDATQYLTASYDSPFKVENRHNEVMFFMIN